MPIHEYECQACKFYTEVMQKITDAPLTRCPSCGKRTLKKLVSAPAFRLKGGGWYETDFKSDKENKRNLVGTEKEEPKADAKAQATDAKAAAPEAKDAKPADSKPVESKAAAPKTTAAGSAATSGRNRVSVSAKAARAAAGRKPTRPSKPKGARRRRR
jgi:putative FmdB family regulatory protein